MELSLIVGIAIGAVALFSLIALLLLLLMRRKSRPSVEKSLGTQMFCLPTTIKTVNDEDLEAQQDPPIQEVARHRIRMSHSPTMRSIKPATRTRSMSVGSQIVSPLSRSSTNGNNTSPSSTSTITNNNIQYKAYVPPSPSVPEIPRLEHIPSSLSAPGVPCLPASLIPGSRITPPSDAWLPPSPTTQDQVIRGISPPSFASQTVSTLPQLSSIQHFPPSRHVSSMPGALQPAIPKRSMTNASAASSIYSVAETPVVYSPSNRYYSVQNTARQSLVHIEGTRNALPELPGREPVTKKHHSWNSHRR